MRTLGNIIWHIPYLGFLKSLLHAIAGLIWCITIIGIPLGMGLFQLSRYELAPFSNGLVTRKELEMLTGKEQDSFVKAWSIVIRILYFPLGLLLAIASIFCIVIDFVTLIGIPCGLAEARALSTIFNPINKICVPRAVAEEIERLKASNSLNKYIKREGSSTSEDATQRMNQRQDASASIANDYKPQPIQTPENVVQDRDPVVSKPSVATSEPEAITVSKSTTTEVDAEKSRTYQPKESDFPIAETSKGNNTILISILVGVLLVFGGVLTYFLWYAPYAKDRDALRTYVVANSVFLRSSQQGGVEYNIVGRVPYGSEVITYSKYGEWAEVKANGQEGFISSAYLLDTSDFNILNNVWGDSDAKECIESSKCRLAVLDYYKKKQWQSGRNGWQIYTRMKDQKPNTVFYPRIYNKNSKFTDFVFITKNMQEGGKRIIVCYSFDDETEKPIFRFSVWGPTEGYIQNILPTRDGVSIVFDNGTRTKVSIE